MTKTMQALIAKRAQGSIYTNGQREATAARKLVAMGLAKSYENFSSVSTGKFGLFPVAVIAGRVTF